MAWTSTTVSFGNRGNADSFSLVDAIPLDEIQAITDMSSANVDDGAKRQGKEAMEEPEHSRLELTHFANSGHILSAALIPGISIRESGQAQSSINIVHKYRFRAQIVTENDGYVLHADIIERRLFEAKHAISSYNSGRKYYIKTDSEANYNKVMEMLTKKAKKARSIKEAKTRLQKVRDRAAVVYASWPFQNLFAILILANFAANVAEIQLIDHPETSTAFYYTDTFFTAVFAFELAFNLFAHPFREFLGSGWNWFDAIVVSMSLASYAMQARHHMI